MTNSFRVHLDHLVSEDMYFNSYVDHRERWLFDDIMLYSGWLAYISYVNVPHLPECMMRKFGYTQTIPIHPIIFAHPSLTRRQMNVMFDDYLNHLVQDEARSIIAKSE